MASTQIRTGQIRDFAEAIDDRVAALLTEGTNITLTYDDAGGTLTITATGGSAGSGELLMQDGVSSPPVPLTTEDGTDWLYQG